MSPRVQIEDCQRVLRTLSTQQVISQVLKWFSSMQEVSFSSPQLVTKARSAASSPFVLARAAASSGDGGGGAALKYLRERSLFSFARRSISTNASDSAFTFAFKNESTILQAS